MTPLSGIVRTIAASISLCLVLPGCETTTHDVQGSGVEAAPSDRQSQS